MRLTWPLAIILAALLLAPAIVTGGGEEPGYEPVEPRIVDHTEMFMEANITEYEGSKTCMECHRDEVTEFFHSYHYQMASLVNDIAGKGEIIMGGRVFYNDFCTAIFLDNGTRPLNWIGYVKLKKAPEGYEELVGAFTGLTGCSMCHGVTMGLPPSWEPSTEQLGNIDCLACHASPSVYLSGPIGIAKGYKNVTKDEQGRLVYVVKVDAMTLARNIIDKPRSENCLACHAYSGGGPGLKRPNISPDLYTGVTEDGRVFDVHIANGLSCIDCHPGDDHRFATSGVDTWSREAESGGGKTRHCTDCHGTAPHEGLKGWILNKFHLEKVACQTCHIPYIAHGDYPTELYRDWSATTFHPDKKRWKFAIPDPETGDTSEWYLYNSIEPVYAWYNGSRSVLIFPEKVAPEEGGLALDPVNGVSAGYVYLVKPLGSKDDGESKIYPFRLHRAIVPYSPEAQTLVPMKVGIAFATGDAKAAAIKGSEASGIPWDGETYVTLVRYMAVNHGVQPAENSLSCFDCHGLREKRMPWSQIGYGHWPEVYFASILAVTTAAIILVAYKLYHRLRK